MTSYQHTQFGSAIVWPLIGAAAIGCAVAFISPIMRVALLVAIPLALVAWTFSKLTITIDEHNVRAAFGPGFVYKQVPLTTIESCEPVRTHWLEGWGIHLSRFGWLYNVSGRDAVAIRLRNGKRFALGTDQPEELAAAIRRLASAR
ncbi:MAG: hypothetical protein ACJ8KU_09680 [Chthoniobacterales bacterium]